MVNELLEKIGNLTLVQASELVKAMEEKFGISTAAPAAVATVTGGDGGGSSTIEEKTEFKIVLEAFSGDKKVDAIKKVREITNLPLMDAKKMVEAGKGDLKDKVPKEEAEKFKTGLEAVGCKVSLV